MKKGIMIGAVICIFSAVLGLAAMKYFKQGKAV